MTALFWIGWGAIALAGLGGIIALSEEDVFLLSAAISLAVSGVVFLALDRMVGLLTAIRDALKPATAAPSGQAEVKEATDHPLGFQPRTPEELQMAIDKLKGVKSAGDGVKYSKDQFRD